METFDYIIVGGGSSGCVAAARLASEGGARLDSGSGLFQPSPSARHAAWHFQDDQRFQIHVIPQD